MAPHLPHTWLRLLVHTAQEPAARALFPTGVRLCARRPGPDWAADGLATAVAPDGTPDDSLIAKGGHARLAGHKVLQRLHRAFEGLQTAMDTGPLGLLGGFAVDVRHTRTQAVR